ncbi:MFS transporter [Streptomyces sp. NPDC047841]|uniref:MFS transporter n=1 Tax=Streptomyces sp. NPDC047841 TaxID=3154708 RepID=UPI0034571F6C
MDSLRRGPASPSGDRFCMETPARSGIGAIMHASIATRRRVAVGCARASCTPRGRRTCPDIADPSSREGWVRGGMSHSVIRGLRAVGSRRLLAACLLGGTAGWSLTAAGAEVTSLARAYHLSLPQVGILTSAFSITYATAQVPSGMAVDRFGARRAGVWGAAMVAAAYAVASVAPWGGVAFTCRAIAGIGAALCYVAGAEAARGSGTGAVGQGVFGGAAAAAGGAALLVVPLAGHALGWRSTWVTSALLALAGLVAVLSAVPAAVPDGAREATEGTGTRHSLLRDGELYRLAAVHAVTFGGSVVLSNWAALILRRTWHVSGTFAAVSASLILLTTIVSRPLGGYLARRRPGHGLRWTVGSLLTGSLCVLALTAGQPAAVAPLLCVVLGIASGLPFAGVFAAAQQRRPDRSAGAVGLINAHANLVIVIGTPLLGAAVAGGWTSTAIVVSAAVWTIPLICLPGGPPGPGRGRPGESPERGTATGHGAAPPSERTTVRDP